MGKDKHSSPKKDIKNSSSNTVKSAKSASHSKTSKIMNKTKSKTKSTSNSGSKTSKPLVKNNKPKHVSENAIDVNKIFDIIDSESKRKSSKKISEKIDSIKPIVPTVATTKPLNVESVFINTPLYEGKTMLDNQTASKNILKSYLEAKQFLKDHGITISTITLDCKLNTLIDVDVFAKNVTLREEGIVSVKYGNRKDLATNRTIVVIKNKKKPSVKNFYNQVTILMKPTNNPIRNYINIKVFKNGSLQMTGCKDMDDFNNVASTLIKILKKGRDVKGKNGKIKHIDFIEDATKISINDVKVRMISINDVAIRMINSNFKLDYKVDRKKLAKILKKNHRSSTKDKEIGYVECKYEPTGGHSCVNIKYQYDEKSKPSIFVFQTGAVIITGAKNLHHIIMAYHFIHKILNKYFDEIRIIDLDHKQVQAEIAKFFQKKNVTKQVAVAEV